MSGTGPKAWRAHFPTQGPGMAPSRQERPAELSASTSHTQHVNQDPKLYPTHTLRAVSGEREGTGLRGVILGVSLRGGDVGRRRGWGGPGHSRGTSWRVVKTATMKTVGSYISATIQGFSMRPGPLVIRTPRTAAGGVYFCRCVCRAHALPSLGCFSSHAVSVARERCLFSFPENASPSVRHQPRAQGPCEP